jgi:hypothetical protein
VHFVVLAFQATAFDGNDNLALFREFYDVTEQIHQNLAQPGHIADQRGRNLLVKHVLTYVRPPYPSLWEAEAGAARRAVERAGLLEVVAIA